MRPPHTSSHHGSGLGFAPRQALLCACGFAALGLLLSLSVILGPPDLGLQVARQLAGLLFVAGSVGLGFALASSLAGR